MPKNKMSFLEGEDMPCLEVQVMPDSAVYQKWKKCQMMPCSEAEDTPEDAVFRRKNYAKRFQIKLCQYGTISRNRSQVLMVQVKKLESYLTMLEFVPDAIYLSY